MDSRLGRKNVIAEYGKSNLGFLASGEDSKKMRVARGVLALCGVWVAFGLVVGVAEAQETACYTYDATGRLTAADYDTGSSGASIDYDLDANDNRSSVTQSASATLGCSTPTVIPGQVPAGDLGSPGGVNRPPVAGNDIASVQINSQIVISVLSNDVDLDGDTLTITSVTQPGAGGGSASVTGGNTTVTYSAPSSENSYVFSYTISDGNGGTDTATVSVDVYDPQGN